MAGGDPWGTHEDNLIREALENPSKKWCVMADEIGRRIGRSAASVKLRASVLQERHAQIEDE